MMKPLLRHIQHISLGSHKLMHLLYRSRFIVIRADVHTLHTHAFYIGKKFHLGKIHFLLPARLLYCLFKILFRDKLRKPDNRNKLEILFMRIINALYILLPPETL